MNAYVKYFDKNSKYMNLLVNDEEVLEKYNEIWNKTKNLFGKKFDSEPVYNDKYIKVKMNSYNTNIFKYYICFSVILLDSNVNVDKKYYPQIF